MNNDANSILMGSGAPALKFEVIGTQHTGSVVAEPTSSQQTDFKTKLAETWPDGSPKMQVLVQMQTNLRDPQRPDDDGTRTLYIKGKELTNAVRQAVRASGANGIHTGGILTVAYIGDGPKEGANLNPPKLYAAQYQPPAVSFNGVTGPAQQPTPAAQPVYAPAAHVQPQMQQHVQAQQPVYAAPAQAPAQAAPLLPTAAGSATPPPGVDPAMWARLSPEQQAAVAAASAQPQAAF